MIEALDLRRSTGYFDVIKWGQLRVNLIGCGALGSTCGRLLAALPIPNIHLYDDDTVLDGNLGSTTYDNRHVGMPKVAALTEAMLAKWPKDTITVTPHQERVTDTSQVEGVVILAVDAQPIRLQLWQGLRYNANVSLLVDGRMEAVTGEVHTVNPVDPTHIDRYERSLKWQYQRPETDEGGACVIYPSIGDTSTNLATWMVDQVRKWHQRTHGVGTLHGRLFGTLRISLDEPSVCGFDAI